MFVRSAHVAERIKSVSENFGEVLGAVSAKGHGSSQTPLQPAHRYPAPCIAAGGCFQMPLNVDALIAKLLAARDSACDRRSNAAWAFSAARAATLAPAGRSSPLPVPCCLQRSRARRSA